MYSPRWSVKFLKNHVQSWTKNKNIVCKTIFVECWNYVRYQHSNSYRIARVQERAFTSILKARTTSSVHDTSDPIHLDEQLFQPFLVQRTNAFTYVSRKCRYLANKPNAPGRVFDFQSTLPRPRTSFGLNLRRKIIKLIERGTNERNMRR